MALRLNSGAMVLLLFLTMFPVPLFGEDDQVFDKPLLIEKSDLPEIPKVLSKSRISGVALIRVSITDTGSIDDVGLIRSTGLPPLDKFLADWVTEWSFLPKLDNNKTCAGFTVVSIRYDLARNSFESPPVNTMAMILPEPYMKIFAEKDSKGDHKRNKRELINPVRGLKAESIPESLLSREIILETTVEIAVDRTGKVVWVTRPREVRDDDLWEWLSSEISLMEWEPIPEDIRRKITLDLTIDLPNRRLEAVRCLLIRS